MSKSKCIKLGIDIDSDSKVPKIKQNPESYFNKSPSWCFSKSDNDYEKWSILQADFFNDILPKLVSFEQRKWSDIISDKKHNHWIKCEDFSKEAQNRINAIPQSFDSLFSLRLTSTFRLFGFIEEGIYYIIWVDKNHEVCPSNLRNT
jgi:hypothetical protein